ncbi:MAG: alanine--tRNA ligase [Microgenomates group bacterium]
MTTDEIREKFIKFFKASPRNHKEISPSSLVPEDDPTTLFTSSGMQKLIPYLMGEEHPEGKRLVDSQPCLRLQDIDEVGNTRHLTFFEMLGNWSLGHYFKEEQLAWFWDFLTKELNLPKEKLYVSVFEGSKEVPKDEKSAKIWKKLGIPEKKIFYYGVKENWWSRSGTPGKMPPGEIGGPDSEIFFDFGTKHNPKYGKECHPNCECGRFSEIGNSVFIQYIKERDSSLKDLPQKNVDFGGGLERLSTAVNNKPDIFQIDLFKPIVKKIEEVSGKSYKGNEVPMRVIADHMRASAALISNDVLPSNKLQGYVLRRLIRRSAIKMRGLNGKLENSDLNLSEKGEIIDVIEEEVNRFRKTLEKGLREIDRLDHLGGKSAFFLYETYGFPLELTEEIAKEKGQKIDKKVFKKEFEKHKKLSRTASAEMFKGGLADASEEVTQLHTATHLLHAALRKILGKDVQQKGSNITIERLRFDFSHSQKLTENEIKKVENLVNTQIKKDLPVDFEIKSLNVALKEGALAFFGEKYDQKVKIYTIGNPKGEWFSKEVCGGPHVTRTGELGRVRIFKQDKIGSGLMRIYAKVEPK